MKYYTQKRIVWAVCLVCCIAAIIAGSAILGGWIGVGAAITILGIFGLICCISFLAADEL